MTQIHRIFALLLLLAFTSATWSQEAPPADAKPVDAAKKAAPKFSATLLLVKSDWSKSPQTKQIETELREALKDASVPKKLLDKLPASGPEILFAPEIVATYSRAEYAELLAWLKARELLADAKEFPASVPHQAEIVRQHIDNEVNKILGIYDADKNEQLEKNERENSRGLKIPQADENEDGVMTREELAKKLSSELSPGFPLEAQTRLALEKEFVDLPAFPEASTTPYIERQPGLAWNLRVQTRQGEKTQSRLFIFERQLTVLEKARGQRPRQARVLDASKLAAIFLPDDVLLINGFPAGSEQPLREAARKKGFEAVVVVRPADEDAGKATPHVRLPRLVTEPSIEHKPQLKWENTAIATTPPSSDVAEEKPQAEPKFSATLLLVRSDWSKSPHAKEIETELREALKDASVPKELLDKLPASGPEILFAPEILAFYSSEHFAQFMSWMRAKELVVAQEPFEQPKQLPQADADFKKKLMSELFAYHDKNRNQKLEQEEWQKITSYAPAETPVGVSDANEDGTITSEEFAVYSQAQLDLEASRTLRIRKDATFVDLPLPKPVRTQPFVSRRPAFTWVVSWQRFEVDSKTSTYSVSRTLTVSEQARGQAKEGLAIMVDSSALAFVLPENHVAALNAFPARAEEEYRVAARRKGFAAVVVLARADDKKAADADPRFHLPDQIEVRHVNYSFDGPRRADTDHVPAQAAADEASLTKIIHLQHASAAELRNTLQQLASADIKLAVDERTNAIVVSGATEKLAELEAIVQRLDEAPGSAAKDKLPAPQPAETVAQLKQQYADAEREAARLAKESQPAKDKLRAAVAKSFELRQKLLQAELAEFRLRSERIEQSLRQRQGIKQQIIERRVEDLRKPGLEWEGAEATPTAGPAKIVAAARPSPEQAARSEAAQRLQELELRQAEALLQVAELELAGSVAANRRTPGVIPVNELARQQARSDIASLGVEKARTMLELFRRAGPDEKPTDSPAVDRATRIKLLELDVKQATLEFETAQAEYKRLEELARNGAIKDSELTESKLALNRARVKLDKIQVRLDVARESASPDGGDGIRP